MSVPFFTHRQTRDAPDRYASIHRVSATAAARAEPSHAAR
jgi:hypothetical protein